MHSAKVKGGQRRQREREREREKEKGAGGVIIQLLML